MANKYGYGKFVLAQFAISYALIWPSHSRSSLAISQSSNAILIASANCEDSLKVSSHFKIRKVTLVFKIFTNCY